MLVRAGAEPRLDQHLRGALALTASGGPDGHRQRLFPALPVPALAGFGGGSTGCGFGTTNGRLVPVHGRREVASERLPRIEHPEGASAGGRDLADSQVNTGYNGEHSMRELVCVTHLPGRDYHRRAVAHRPLYLDVNLIVAVTCAQVVGARGAHVIDAGIAEPLAVMPFDALHSVGLDRTSLGLAERRRQPPGHPADIVKFSVAFAEPHRVEEGTEQVSRCVGDPLRFAERLSANAFRTMPLARKTASVNGLDTTTLGERHAVAQIHAR